MYAIRSYYADFLLGMVSFLVEMGAIPTHVVCHNAPRKGWEDDMKAILEKSNRASECNISYNFV